MSGRQTLSTVVWVVTSLLSASAMANVAAPVPFPAVVMAPAQASQSGLEVVSERLSFDCREVAGEARCRFEADYTIRNPTDATIEGVSAFYGLRAAQVTVELDGARSSRGLNPVEQAALDRAVEQAMQQPSPDSSARTRRSLMSGVDRHGFWLMVPPGATRRLVARGEMRPSASVVPSYVSTPALTRHLLLGDPAPPTSRFQLRYFVAPIRTFSGAPTLDVSLTLPASWTLMGARDDAPVESLDDGRVRRRQKVDPAITDVLTIDVVLPSDGYRGGGPLIGIGGTVDDSSHLRARLGWEIAAPSWLLTSVVADTDFQNDLIITPQVIAATPSIMSFIPSLGGGLGVPIRVLPEVDVGVRIHMDLHWPVVAFVVALDIYPGLPTDHPGMFEATLLFQVGL